MGFFRPLHRKHYDSERGRFATTALDVKSGEPFSVVDCDCATAENNSFCRHITRYYNEQTGDPALYWPIPDAIIPAGCRIEVERTASGDECHRNIHDWKRTAITGLFRKVTLDNLVICLPDGERPPTKADLEFNSTRLANE